MNEGRTSGAAHVPLPGGAARQLHRNRGIGGPGREAARGQSLRQQGQSAGIEAATPLTSPAAGSAPPGPGEAPGTLGHGGPAAPRSRASPWEAPRSWSSFCL